MRLSRLGKICSAQCVCNKPCPSRFMYLRIIFFFCFPLYTAWVPGEYICITYFMFLIKCFIYLKNKNKKRVRYSSVWVLGILYGSRQHCLETSPSWKTTNNLTLFFFPYWDKVISYVHNVINRYKNNIRMDALSDSN